MNLVIVGRFLIIVWGRTLGRRQVRRAAHPWGLHRIIRTLLHVYLGRMLLSSDFPTFRPTRVGGGGGSTLQSPPQAALHARLPTHGTNCIGDRRADVALDELGARLEARRIGFGIRVGRHRAVNSGRDQGMGRGEEGQEGLGLRLGVGGVQRGRLRRSRGVTVL